MRLLFFIMLALSFNLLAQPISITWRGKLLGAYGNTITQNNVAMSFAIFGQFRFFTFVSNK